MYTGEVCNMTRWNREEELADEDVANMLRMTMFDFDGDGRLAIYWDDSGVLYDGHKVITSIGPDGEPFFAGMEGSD
jgi:hypothetical protein